MNRTITCSEIASVAQKLPINKSPGSDNFTGKYYQNLPLPKYSNNYRGRNASELLLWGQHHLVLKPDKDITQKRNLEAQIFDKHRCKNPQQNNSKLNPTLHQKILYHARKIHQKILYHGIYSRDGRMLQRLKVNQHDIPY